MAIIFGLLGLLGYEALRLYKAFVGKKPLIPRAMFGAYCAIISILGVFSGACAYAMANGNLATSLFVGFSVPTGARALLARPNIPTTSATEDLEVDEIETEDLANSTIRDAVQEYFV